MLVEFFLDLQGTLENLLLFGREVLQSKKGANKIERLTANTKALFVGGEL